MWVHFRSDPLRTLYWLTSSRPAAPSRLCPHAPKIVPTEGLWFFSEPGFFFIYAWNPTVWDPATHLRGHPLLTLFFRDRRSPQPPQGPTTRALHSPRAAAQRAARRPLTASVPAQCLLTQCPPHYFTWSRRRWARRWARRCRAASTRRPRRPPSLRACALRRCLLGGADDVRGCQNARG